jgi:hypothetical protein
VLNARRRAGKTFLGNIALAAFAAAATLGVAELAVRKFVHVRHVGPPVTTYDSIYRTRLKRNFSAVQITPEFRMRLTTNSMGYRAAEPTGPLKGGLLYLGDSFTVGYGVNDGEEYPALLAKQLSAMGAGSVPYINAGRGNTGQSQWIKFLRREAPGYDPSFVIVQVNETDFSDNLIDGLLRVEEDGAITELPLTRPSLGRVAQRVMDAMPFVSRTYLYGLVRQAYFSLANPPAEGPPDAMMREKQDRLLIRLLEEVDRLCDEGGWPVVALRVALDSTRDARLDSMFTAHGIPSRRIAGFSELSDSYYEVDGHWTAVGHQHAANTILELLAEADSAWLARLKTRN